jgi:hypothetical protein
MVQTFGVDLGLAIRNGEARCPLMLDKATQTAPLSAQLRTQFLAPPRPARRQHQTAAFGRHAGAKAVAALAHQFARLIGPFHGIVSAAHATPKG